MSNPFAVFRKNQTAWMAGLVLLALLAFVVAPALEQVMSAFGRGGSGNEEVVAWNGGVITVAELQTAQQRNGMVNTFLSSLAEKVIDAGGMPQVPRFAFDPQSNRVLSVGLQLSTIGEQVCRDRIFLTYADEIGITFDDTAVDDFIKLFCDNKITDEELAKTLRETTSGNLSVFDLRDIIKKEMSLAVFGQVLQAGFLSQPPGKTFRDFKKLNETATVEAYPVLVADYMDKVTGEPTEAEIQAIYSEGSMRGPDPSSPTPGFIRPYTADFEYVLADLAAWTDREKAKLTEEELRAEYDRRVELGQMQVVDEPEAEATSEIGSESDAGEQAGAPEAGAPEAGAPESAAEPNVEPAVTGDAGSTDPNSGDGSSAGSSSGDGDADQSNLQGSQKTRFVAFNPQAEDAPETAGQEPEVATDEQASAAPSESAQTGPPTVVQPPQLGQESADQGVDMQLPKMRTKTFEEARDEIATALAQANAGPAIEAAMKVIEDEHMKPYFQEYRSYKAYADADDLDEAEEVKRPKRPDLKTVAESVGLSYQTTGMVDPFALNEMQFGQSMISSTNPGMNGTVVQTMMNLGTNVYRPTRSTFLDQAALMAGEVKFQQFLFWKVDEKAAFIPELDDVRDEIIEAWKTQKARLLAEEAAKAIAAKVGTGEDAWAGAIDVTEQSLILKPAPFSWYDRSAQGAGLSVVRDLDDVGNSFFQSVFTASPATTVVAANQPQQTYYVTRVQEFGPSDEALMERFEADPQKSGAINIARQEVNNTIIDWMEQLEERLNVQWQMRL